MTRLYCLSYASTSTVSPIHLAQELEKILKEARTLNQQQGICGVLCYGNGYFYQYIEGSERTIKALYQKLIKDSRHRHIRVLHQGLVHTPRFSTWHMKYVSLDALTQTHPLGQSLSKFNPYELEDEQHQQWLMRLSQQHQHMTQVTAQAGELTTEMNQQRRLRQLDWLFVLFVGLLFVMGIYLLLALYLKY